MKQRKFGQTKSELFPVGLGAMPLSIEGRPSREQAFAVIERALQFGVNLIDTANVYCLDNQDIGHNETLIAEALATLKPKQEIFVATKGGLTRPDGRWERRADPEFLRKSCEASLRALNTDQIFLYQLHAPDPAVRYEDTLECLAKLQKEGKVLHLGLSNVSIEQAQIAQTFFKVQSIQNLAHPLRSSEYGRGGILEYCIKHQITFIPYSPMGGGYKHVTLAKNKILTKIAETHKRSAHQIILAWHLAQSDQVIPIPGAGRPESIESSAQSVDIALAVEEIAEINGLDPTTHFTSAPEKKPHN